MDNVTVDLGPETDVAVGDPAVLIGARARSASSARRWRGGWARSTTRSPAASRARVPRAARSEPLTEALDRGRAGARACARRSADGPHGVAGGRRGARRAAGPRRSATWTWPWRGDPRGGGASGRPRRSAARCSRCRRSSARGGCWTASGASTCDVSPLQGATHRGGPGPARLHGQRDGGAAGRRRRARSARRPRATCEAGVLRVLGARRLRGRPAAAAAAGAPGRRAGLRARPGDRAADRAPPRRG